MNVGFPVLAYNARRFDLCHPKLVLGVCPCVMSSCFRSCPFSVSPSVFAGVCVSQRCGGWAVGPSLIKKIPEATSRPLVMRNRVSVQQMRKDTLCLWDKTHISQSRRLDHYYCSR
jgi:hypothetical protein